MTIRTFIGFLLAAWVAQMAVGAAPPARKASARPAAKKSSAAKKKAPLVDPTVGDNVDGDDLVVRRAAVASLGNLNGSVVAVNPESGRVLTIVNQKLAYQSGFIPCSTVKLVTALAALSEGVVDRGTFIPVGRYLSMNLTSALAKSNNPYFAVLGTRLGFDKVSYYARLFGLGEKAGLDIAGEQAGRLPDAPPKNGGVGMMCSFGEGIAMTPLQLAGMLSAIANGGTLYYMQYPRSQAEAQEFAPRVKRRLPIGPWLPDIKIGMRAAVDFGTARRLGNSSSEPVLGKTGTCTDFSSSNHMGWFGSFNDVGRNRLAVVVMLTGGRSVNGPVAAGVAGKMYHALSEQKYFAEVRAPQPKRSDLPDLIVTMPVCCGQ
jgi:cell division protein FtsI/penicillin-binding protein 2